MLETTELQNGILEIAGQINVALLLSDDPKVIKILEVQSKKLNEYALKR